MKRIFFIIGIVIILILAGILLFLLFANDQQKKDVFSAFGLDGTTVADVSIGDVVDAILPGNNGKLLPLRQLTFKRVVGAAEATSDASSTNPAVYYAEAGTGYIFSLDVVSGEERKISNITIPTANQAAIAPDGTLAAVAANVTAEGRDLTVISLSKESGDAQSNKLSEPVKDFTLSTDNFVLYTTLSGGTLAGRGYNPATQETKTLFSLPFKEATVRFGRKSTDSIFVYPKTADSLEGYLYEVNGGVIQRLPVAGFGLAAISSNNYQLYSLFTNGVYTSYAYNAQGKESSSITTVIPEKCHFLQEDARVFCGINFSLNKNSASNWYKGTEMISDDLWLLDLTGNNNPTLLATPKDLVGQDIDVLSPISSQDGNRFYFTNKIDGTLWILDRALVETQ